MHTTVSGAGGTIPTSWSGPLDPLSVDEPTRVLANNEFLFREGDAKSHLYEVLTGALWVYESRWNGIHSIKEFAFPGDIVGLGFLDTHICNCRAALETCVLCFPLSAQARLIPDNPRVQAQLEDAIESEFECLRDSSIRFGQENPRGRLAAFLLALSSENRREGRDPTVLTPTPLCQMVADLLALSVDTLASLLVDLEHRGVVEPYPPQGLRLTDITALERLTRRTCLHRQSRPPPLHEWSGSA